MNGHTIGSRNMIILRNGIGHAINSRHTIILRDWHTIDGRNTVNSKNGCTSNRRNTIIIVVSSWLQFSVSPGRPLPLPSRVNEMEAFFWMSSHGGNL